VEPDQQDIVGEKHEGRKDVGCLALAEDVVSEIAWVSSIDQYERTESVNPALGRLILHSQISLICGYFMIYLCMVIEVIQNNTPARTMVIIPGTHPRTLHGATMY
jgi:hypothetical protein